MFVPIMNKSYVNHYCCNLSLGLATKAKACKGVGQEWNSRVIFHAPWSVRKCEGMNPHIHKWASTLGIGLPMDFWIFRGPLQGSKLTGLKSSFYYWKSFEMYMFKMGLHGSFGYLKLKLWPKERSKVQFDSGPQKVKNRPKLLVCRWCVTYHWKDLDEGYNFALDLISIENLTKNVWAPKVTRVLIS
jgi:hypothetical protein